MSAKLQCEQGALFSYREAEQNLEKLNCQRRSVNNHTQVKRITDKVGAVLAETMQPIRRVWHDFFRLNRALGRVCSELVSIGER